MRMPAKSFLVVTRRGPRSGADAKGGSGLSTSGDGAERMASLRQADEGAYATNAQRARLGKIA